MNRLVSFAGLLVFASSASAQIVINEIRTDQSGTDNQEYFELYGPVGASLNSLTYIVIGDGTGGSGVVESVTSLAGFSMVADQHFLVAESTWTTSPPGLWPGGSVDYTPTGTNPLNFENADNVTHMLVADFTGSLNQDLDTNDDGIFDLTPWSSILDSVAIINTGTGDLVYSTVQVGPDGSFHPSHIFRSPTGTGNWAIGVFDGSQSGWLDTPGTANPVPEPATLAAMGLGVAGLLARRRRS